MSSVTTPGNYHAQGDPPGTVRYWDGHNWVGGPTTISTPTLPDVNFDQYAGFWERATAHVLDLFILAIAMLSSLFATVMTLWYTNSMQAGDSYYYLILLLPFIYLTIRAIMIAKLGYTPGKFLVGLRITPIDGTSPPGFGPAFLRTLMDILVTFLLPVGVVVLLVSAVLVSIDDERRSVYDHIASTRVVYSSYLRSKKAQ